MRFSDNQIDFLREKIADRLSEKRFSHTLGVLRAAERIGKSFMKIDVSELSAAALLHDVTKELCFEEQLALFFDVGITLSDSDIKSPLILHSLSAPFVVKRDFPEFATDNVLSAVKNHTTGAPGMSLFDEIILISDYIEDSRTYESCVAVRDALYSALAACRTESECEIALHKSVYESLVFTEMDVIKRGRFLNERSVSTKAYFASLLCSNE